MVEPVGAGVVAMPLAPTRRHWQQLVGRRPHAVARGPADEVVGYGRAVHADAGARNPVSAAVVRQGADRPPPNARSLALSVNES